MAKGDIVIGRLAAAGVFTPATGVEVMITCVTNGGATSCSWGLDAGAVDNWFIHLALPMACETQSIKVGITNAAGLRSNDEGSYSGVQVK